MLPAPGETSWPAAVVESERSVAGDVFERNGHMDLDWRRRASMMKAGIVVRRRDQTVCSRSVGRAGGKRYVGGGGRWTEFNSYAESG
jgi:hypothetical protein